MKLELTLRSHIKKAILLDEVERSSVVLIDVVGHIPEDHFARSANIFCIKPDQTILWQVQAPPPQRATDSFIGMQWTNGKLTATRFFGSIFEINLETGVAEEIGWQK